MRKFAGILMIVGGIMGFIILRAAFGVIPGLLGWVFWIWLILVLTGGYYTLKAKNWKHCRLAAFLLLPYLAVPVLVWRDAGVAGITVFAVLMTFLWIGIAVLPVYVVHARREQWAEGTEKD